MVVGYRLPDKVAVVTGAARGLGRSHALALAAEGANIAAVDIGRTPGEAAYDLARRSELQEVVKAVRDMGRQAIAVECDVTRSDEVRSMAREVLRQWGRVDILVNNAGVISVSTVVEMREAEWDLVVDVSLKGTFLCCRHVLPAMMKQRSGRVINTGSIAGKEGIALNAHYSAAKAGVHAFTRALAKEVASYGINVNAVAPGGVNTPLMKGIAGKLAQVWNVKPEEAYQAFCQRFHVSGAPIEPADVSNVVVWLASDETRNLTGQVIHV